MINYHYISVIRKAGLYYKDERKNVRRMAETQLTDYFGTEEWKSIDIDSTSSNDDFLNLYLNRIQKHRQEIVVTRVSQDGGGYQYRIILATKRTRGGNPWLSAVRDVKDRVERTSLKELERYISVIKGDQTRLDTFW
jgi:hypothetical protein